MRSSYPNGRIPHPECRMIAQLIAAALVIVQSRPALDSATVTRVLDQLKAGDSTVCALAGEALTGYGGWGWENWGYTDQVMPMPQPTPTPTPTPMPRGGDGEIPVHMGMHGRSHDLDPGVLRAFRAVIRDDNRCVRNIAAWALGEIQDKQAVHPLSVALSDAAADVRLTAVWALGEIQDASAVPLLANTTKD